MYKKLLNKIIHITISSQSKQTKIKPLNNKVIALSSYLFLELTFISLRSLRVEELLLVSHYFSSFCCSNVQMESRICCICSSGCSALSLSVWFECHVSTIAHVEPLSSVLVKLSGKKFLPTDPRWEPMFWYTKWRWYNP